VISVNEVPHSVDLKSFAVLAPEEAGQPKLPVMS
jgi:hypothetical protein